MTRLQLLRVPVRECGDPDRRYQVRLLQDDGPVTLYTSPRYRDAREAYAIEAVWRGWEGAA